MPFEMKCDTFKEITSWRPGEWGMELHPWVVWGAPGGWFIVVTHLETNWHSSNDILPFLHYDVFSKLIIWWWQWPIILVQYKNIQKDNGQLFQVDLVIFTLVWWRTTLVPTIWPSTSVRPGSSSRRVKTALQRESTPPFLPSDISDNYLCCCRLWIERTEPAPSSSQSPPHLVFVGMTHINWEKHHFLSRVLTSNLASILPPAEACLRNSSSYSSLTFTSMQSIIIVTNTHHNHHHHHRYQHPPP